jgi:hypothetical protein
LSHEQITSIFTKSISTVTTPKESTQLKAESKVTEEIRTVSSTGGEKGTKEARFDLIPIEALTEVAILYGRGAEKYAAHNWRKGYEWSKSYAALQRHATQFWSGEDNDPEMRTSHMASVVFHAMALIVFMKDHPDFDDRFKGKVKEVEASSNFCIVCRVEGNYVSIPTNDLTCAKHDGKELCIYCKEPITIGQSWKLNNYNQVAHRECIKRINKW